MSDHAHEGLGVEPGPRRDVSAQLLVVGWGSHVVESLDSAEDHHDRTQARREQLGLRLRIAAGGEDALSKLEQFSHRLVLELQAEVSRVHGDSAERRCTEKNAVPLENVSVFHGEDVRASLPLTERQRQWWRVAVLAPGARYGRAGAHVLHGELIHDDENVVIGALWDVLSRRRGSVQHHRTELRAVDLL